MQFTYLVVNEGLCWMCRLFFLFKLVAYIIKLYHVL